MLIFAMSRQRGAEKSWLRSDPQNLMQIMLSQGLLKSSESHTYVFSLLVVEFELPSMTIRKMINCVF